MFVMMVLWNKKNQVQVKIMSSFFIFYVLIALTLGGCIDVDECSNGTNTCSKLVKTSKCVNLPGNYKCNCPTGYKDLNGTCIDFDECLYHSQICSGGAKCINSDGSYKCVQKCQGTWNETTIGDRNLCYKDLGLHYMNENSYFLCNKEAAWLMTPKNAKENADFKSLLNNIGLGKDHGAALGPRRIKGVFLDFYNRKLTYRKGSNFY